LSGKTIHHVDSMPSTAAFEGLGAEKPIAVVEGTIAAMD
jgi:hypothetical protein